jgi:flagellar assembly factor FliW
MADNPGLVKVVSATFGTVEIPEDKLISVPNGIIGFPDCRKYALLDPSKGMSLFLWLQSIDEPELAFIVTDPLVFVPEYQIQGSEPALERINVVWRKPPALFSIVTVPHDDPERVSLNLLAPLLFFSDDNELHQIVLEKAEWPLKYYIVQPSLETEPEAPSMNPNIEGAI